MILFQDCVFITEGGCTLGQNTATTPKGTDEDSNSVEDTTTAVSSTTEKAEVTTPAPVCPPGIMGNVPNPDHCGSFYMCTNGIAIPLQCNAGFEFDPEVKVS